MRFIKIDMTRRRINAHFQFYTEIVDLLQRAEPVRQTIAVQFRELEALYCLEDEAIKKIRKSPLTANIAAADRDRDRMFRGLSDTNHAALNHYSPDVESAAKRIQIVLDTYGNIATLPMDDKTSAINNLVSDLSVKHADDVETTGLIPWVEELQRRNETLTELVRSRYMEIAGRPNTVLANIRVKVDEAYRVVTHCIEALWILAADEEAKAPYAEFIQVANVVIEHYNTIFARNKGHQGNTGSEIITDNTPGDADQITETPLIPDEDNPEGEE